ncbi:MAG: 30S ribosomal protein S4 [Bacteroidetes bacterium]|nr:MAG: 30S ribosomal protein S4 [Bacteroidota bacterium]MBL1145957.1 30S ribosomal protein S4 [Bacteroidota bacterium]MCB0803255.1 30S ribosomal protein S4 [Flavobacteriales bacterium]NOG58751.1 30S ribosomal protein S4 [Bacteroidota bacterium]
MARYRGPKSKIARKFREPIFGPDRALEKKNYPPGQHGPNKRRGKQSEYSIQLMEKQKAKYTYGILEKQFANLFHEASRTKGITGENLLKLCESRLDNVVYRLGMAPSRRAARQMVGHKHFKVNGSVVNIPSYHMKAGDVVEVRERSKSLEIINETLANRKENYDWLEWDSQTMKGKFVNAPERTQIPENIKEQLIVELYSK